MAAFNDRPRSTRGSRSGCIWNVLTVLASLGALVVIGVFYSIFSDPHSAFNPFPPPTMPVLLELPTITPTRQGELPPSWTPAPTLEPTLTNTPRPSSTLPPSPTFFNIITLSPPPPTETGTPPAGMPYQVDQGSPVHISSTALHPEAGCNWMGVGGQVVDQSGGPVTGLEIRLGGTLAGVSIPGEFMPTLTGLAIQYGRAGYEFKLADLPVASNGTLWLQLIDQSGRPLSDRIAFDTYDDCQRNLVIINFRQVR